MGIYRLTQAPVFKEPGDIYETSPFGEKRGTYIHKGVDIVRRVGGGNTTATIVAIDHGGGLVTKYFHLKYGSIPVGICIGATVNRGATLGYMGNTGDSYGAHLHFQIEQNGKPIDGAPYLKGQKVIGGTVANIPAEEYIKKIVAKVGYDDPAAAVAAFKKAQHPFLADLWRKLWEALG